MKQERKPTMFRQGDVLIELVNEELPADAKQVKPDSRNRLVLADGEATGHAHAVSANGAALYDADTGLMLQVNQPTAVVHEEHSAINLDTGLYKVTRQKEYFPTEIRNVAD
jgi:hypothetical protein